MAVGLGKLGFNQRDRLCEFDLHELIMTLLDLDAERIRKAARKAATDTVEQAAAAV